MELFRAVGLPASICVGGVVGAEHAINIMEQVAGCVVPNGLGTLPETNVIVHINVDVVNAPVTVDRRQCIKVLCNRPFFFVGGEASLGRRLVVLCRQRF